MCSERLSCPGWRGWHTQHLSLALEKLEKVPADNNADEKICQAKIDAIEEVVVQREETNRSLITLYEKLYDAIR